MKTSNTSTTHDTRFAGKVAIVTGGGDPGDTAEAGLGIGAEISELLAAEGAHVVVVDRDLGLASATADRIGAAGGEAAPIRADVSSESDCREAVAFATHTYGQLDVLVNNVGIESYPRRTDSNGKPLALAHPPLISEVEEYDWDKVMAVNVKGMVLMTKYAVRHMGAGSAIVNIGALAAYVPLRGTAPYAVSKGAVLTLTKAIAIDHAPVRANCVHPGSVWTPIIRRKLPNDPELVASIREERIGQVLVDVEGTATDIARATAFLASDDARWITGQSISVDGGRLLAASEIGVLSHAKYEGAQA